MEGDTERERGDGAGRGEREGGDVCRHAGTEDAKGSDLVISVSSRLLITRSTDCLLSATGRGSSWDFKQRQTAMTENPKNICP